MRIVIMVCAAILISSTPSGAQDGAVGTSPSAKPEAQENERKSAEIKAATDRARARQRVTDQRNNALWERWIYAVCIGCGWVPRDVRIVHTHPLRVLAGIPAADDDARERGGRPPT